jgi:hypothetical protein
VRTLDLWEVAAMTVIRHGPCQSIPEQSHAETSCAAALWLP